MGVGAGYASSCLDSQGCEKAIGFAHIAATITTPGGLPEM